MPVSVLYQSLFYTGFIFLEIFNLYIRYIFSISSAGTYVPVPFSFQMRIRIFAAASGLTHVTILESSCS